MCVCEWAVQITEPEQSRRIQCRLDHCERVKWYAPHVRHLVLDIHVQQAAEGYSAG